MGANNKLLLERYDITGGTKVTDPVICRGVSRLSFQNNWTGTVAGTFSWEGSNHKRALEDPNNADVVWTPLTVTLTHGTNPAAGAPGSNVAILTNPPRCVRQRLAGTGGAGVVNCWLDLDNELT